MKTRTGEWVSGHCAPGIEMHKECYQAKGTASECECECHTPVTWPEGSDQ